MPRLPVHGAVDCHLVAGPDDGALDVGSLGSFVVLAGIFSVAEFSDAFQGSGKGSCGLVEVWHVAPIPVQFAAVLLGEAGGVHERGKDGLGFVGREDEDFGSGSWVEPALDPAPDSGEESRCSDNLPKISHGLTRCKGTDSYKNPIQSLWVMRRGQHARILHMTLEVPELLQSHARDVHNVRRAHDGRFGIGSGQRRAER